MNRLQPDLSIKGGHGDYIGNDRFNRNGAGQSATIRARRGGRPTFFLCGQNDAFARRDVAALSGTRGNRNFRLTYFAGSEGRANITAMIAAGAYRSEKLDPGQFLDYQVKIKPGRRSGIVRYLGSLQARSLLKPSKVDWVRMIYQ